MERPTIFISSTIYDFRDMRSAIKDHLERNGCRVLASEFNDFTKRLDQHSYQACLDSIQQADFFLLLIGARVGGWYDETNRISITQQEYRTAYRLALAGRIRLLSFARADIWVHRQNIKDLQNHLEELSDVDDALRQKILRYPTTIASDSAFIASFLNEVSKNKETSEASKGKGSLPVANWIHTFNGFSDIRDVLDPLILGGLSVKNATGQKALQNQLLALLRDVLPLIRGKATNPSYAVKKLFADIKLSVDNLLKSVEIEEETWTTFVLLAVIAPRSGLNAAELSAALGTDLLLAYEPKTSTFHTTKAYDVLTDLVDQLRKFEQLRPGADLAKLIKFGQRKGSVSIPVELAATYLQFFFRWSDICNLAKALALHLEGKPLMVPDPMPLTPFADQEDAVSKERVSLDHVREFVGLDSENRKS